MPPIKCFPDFYSRTVYDLEKTAKNLYIFAHVNVGCPDDSYPKLNICVLGLILDSYEYILVAYLTFHCKIEE